VRLLPLLAAAVAQLAAPAAAREVGRFALVEKEVKSLKPGAAEPVAATAGAAIVLGETESTGPGSAAKMLFGEGALVSLGQNTTFKVSPEAVDQATGRAVSAFELAAGKARVFVSRFWSGRPDVRVKTRSAVVGIKGSEAIVEAFLDGRTTVTLLAGEGWVEAGGQRRELRAGQRVRISPGGAFLDDAAPVDAEESNDLWRRTEPTALLERALAGAPPVLPAPDPAQWAAQNQNAARARARIALNTSPAATAGLLADSDHTLPETAAFQCVALTQPGSQVPGPCVPQLPPQLP